MSRLSSGYGLAGLGRVLLRRIFVLLKAAADCERCHPAMGGPVEDLLKVVRELHRRREEASLTFRGGRLYCGETALHPAAGEFEASLAVRRLMRKLDIGTIVFTAEAGPEGLDEAAHLLIEGERMEPKDRFTTFLLLQGVAGLRLTRMHDDIDRHPGPERDRQEEARTVYARTLEAVSEVTDDARRGRMPGFRRCRRMVHRLVDTLQTAEEELLGLTNIRCHDEYTSNHPVNVAILSLSVGLRLGLAKASLAELGMGALFHDIGQSSVPLGILNKPSAPSAGEWDVMCTHPVLGVKELLRLKGVDGLTARMMTCAFEHHLNCDLSGYPEIGSGRGVSLFGRIVAIADAYDALSSRMVCRREAHPPDRTLRLMLSCSGTHYDPVLMKLFVNCVGLYPAGTLCVLDSGEMAVVVRASLDPDSWSRPVVRIISDAAGNMKDGVTVDLSETGETRALARTLDAERYGIDVAHYFL